MHAAGDKLSAFLLQFCIFQSIGGKNAYLSPIWEKICIFPPFLSPFNHFFPKPVTWSFFLFAPPLSEKYTPLESARENGTYQYFTGKH